MGFLRFFLAFSVVNVHANLLGFNLMYADVAVQSFYVISGFYMAMVLNEKYNRPGVTYTDFLLSRFFRIIPAYILVVFLTVSAAAVAWFGFGVTIPPLQHWQVLFNKLSLTTIISVIFIQFSLVGTELIHYFTLNASGGLTFTAHFSQEPIKLWRLLTVPQAWTLALEFYFYLLAPFIVRRSVGFIFGLIVTSFLVRLILALQFDVRFDPWSYRFFPSELLFFLAGSLTYRLSSPKILAISRFNIRLITGICFILIMAAGVIARYGHVGHFYSVSPLFIGLLFLWLPKLFLLTKNKKIDRYIGELSYPLYISHVLVIWLAELVFVKGSLQHRIIVGLGSILLSILIYELLERRVDDFRHRLFVTKEKKIE
ncbi:MAG: acyltransferase [Methylophilaceae bacterium]